MVVLSQSLEGFLDSCTVASAVLSLVGSSCILYTILMRESQPHLEKNKWFGTDSFERIMVALSLFDIVTSFSFALQPFLIQKGSSAFSFGNALSCRFMGTMQQIGTASIFYYGLLSYYYLLVIRFRVPKTTIAKRVEPFFHILGTGFPLATGVCGFALDMYNPLDAFSGCWVAYYPKGCVGDECYGDVIAWIYMGIWFFFFSISVVVNNLVVYFHIRQKYAPTRHLQSWESNEHRSSTITSQRDENDETAAEQSRLIRQVATQGFLFVFAFFFSTIPFFTMRFMEQFKSIPLQNIEFFPLWLLQSISIPSMGLINALIFYRPRYIAARTANGSVSRWMAFRKALATKDLVFSRRSRDINSFSHSGGEAVIVSGGFDPASGEHYRSGNQTGSSSALPLGITPELDTVVGAHLDQKESDDGLVVT